MLGRMHGTDVELQIDARVLDRDRRPRAGAAADRARGAPQRRAARPRRARDRPASARRRTARSSSRSPTTGSGSIPTAPELRSRHLGLTSMEERARELARTAADRSRPGRRHDGPDRAEARWLTRSRSWSSTTTRSCARDCARSSGSRTGSRSSARPRTARRRVEQAERLDPDVILMDLVMPESRRGQRDAGAQASARPAAA